MSKHITDTLSLDIGVITTVPMMMMMKQLTLILLFLAFCLDAALAKCNLAGQWKNDQGSTMTISDVKENGVFSGSYLSAVSAPNMTIMGSPLIGYQKLNGFGFTVKFEFPASTSVFTGQCFINKGDKVLYTMWLMRSLSQDVQDNWAQTRVGYDRFYPLS
ncbi:avidin-like [Pseudophryne corroboree]|uniref:avidin-like n=1 Tax=Pseudophryne corroboree TaxID=495146 RepID=UPI00308180F6